MPTRRTVLLAGLATLGTAAVGVGAIAMQGSKLRDAPPDLKVLDAWSFSVLAAIADTLHPASGGLPSGSEAGVPQDVDAALLTLPEPDREEFVLALGIIENALVSTLLGGPWSPFSACDEATRTAALTAWATSAFDTRRQAFKAIKGLCAGSYWSHPDVIGHTGYRGAPNFGQAQAEKPVEFG